MQYGLHMARPSKDQAKNRPHMIGLRVAEGVREWLEHEASVRDMPMSDVVHEILVAASKKKAKAA